MGTKRLIYAYCSVTVEGHSYQELDSKARSYAAAFFGAELGDLLVTSIPTASVIVAARFGEDPKFPETWSARFRVGCFREFADGEIPPTGDEDDENDKGELDDDDASE